MSVNDFAQLSTIPFVDPPADAIPLLKPWIVKFANSLNTRDGLWIPNFSANQSKIEEPHDVCL